MHRFAAAAVLASVALALPACGGGGSTATKADVEAQVRTELPQMLQLQQNQAVLQRLTLAFGVVVRVVGAKCALTTKNKFDCSADALGSNGIGGYRSFTIDMTADCPDGHCTLRFVQ